MTLARIGPGGLVDLSPGDWGVTWMTVTTALGTPLTWVSAKD